MDGALLAQASASCWRQLASATAESGSAVLHLLVTQSHNSGHSAGRTPGALRLSRVAAGSTLPGYLPATGIPRERCCLLHSPNQPTSG